ncbi:MAG: OmpP1/FadL family transporter [Candidatus Zixiibacteriota bacterium]
MKWLLIKCTLALMLFTVAISAQDDRPSVEAYSFNFTGAGARAEGMGKAFIAVSDDITAGSWNPAGLYIQEKPILGFSYGSLIPRGSTNLTTGTNIWKFEHGGSFYDITSFNVLAPVRIKGHHFVGSFNYTRNFDEFQGWSISGLDSMVMRGEQQVPLWNIYTDWTQTSELQGGVNSVDIGFGTRLYENLSVGVSLNIYTGEAVKVRNLVSNEDWVPIDSESVQHEVYVYTQDIIDSNKFSGFNFTVGLKLHSEKLDAGLIVRTPYSLNVKTGRSIFFISRRGAPVPGAQLQVSFSDTTYYDNLLTKYEMPIMLGAGIAYRPAENLLLAADAEFRSFSGAIIEVRDSLFIDPGGKNREYFTEIDPEWNNVFTVRMGGEYLYKTDIGVIPVRAGFGYIPLPAPNIDMSEDTSTAAGYTLSVGTGIHWNQIYLDWAYSYSSSKWEYRTFDQKSRNHHFNFTFTGYF